MGAYPPKSSYSLPTFISCHSHVTTLVNSFNSSSQLKKYLQWHCSSWTVIECINILKLYCYHAIHSFFVISIITLSNYGYGRMHPWRSRVIIIQPATQENFLLKRKMRVCQSIGALLETGLFHYKCVCRWVPCTTTTCFKNISRRSMVLWAWRGHSIQDQWQPIGSLACQAFYPSSGEICLSLSTRQGKVGEKLLPACFAKMIVIYFHCLSLNFSVNISRCVLDNASIHCLDKISVHFSQDGIVDIFQSMSQDHT